MHAVRFETVLKRMKKKLSIFVLLLAATGLLQAAVIVQTHEIAAHGPGNSDNKSIDSWSFDEFDNLDGAYTLNSVQISFRTSVWGGFIGSDNDGLDGGGGVVSFNLWCSLTSTKTLLDENFSGDWVARYFRMATEFVLASTSVDNDGDGYQEGGLDWDSFSGPIDEASATVKTDAISIADFLKNQYIGTGTFEMSVTDYQTLNTLTGGNLETQSNGQLSSGSVTLTYDYVPEPAAIGLIGLGGIITLTINRIRRRNTV
jgi:hypothetical protein